MLSKLSGAHTVGDSRFEKHREETVSWSGLSCLPVSEQELVQTAQQDI